MKLNSPTSTALDSSTYDQTQSPTVQAQTIYTTAISNSVTISTTNTSITPITSSNDDQIIIARSSDTENVLSILNETFQTTITGQPSDISPTQKQFRKQKSFVCLNPNHHPTKCVECETIQKELNEKKTEDNQQITEITAISKDFPQKDEKDFGEMEVIQPRSRQDRENAWQVNNIENYDTFRKFNLSPITITSARKDESQNAHSKAEVDSNSFIILRDEKNTAQGVNLNTFNENHCVTCCFCNPHMHHHVHYSPKPCDSCAGPTPTTTSSYQPSKSNPITDPMSTARSSTAPSERIYERTYKSNHTHVQTKCKESDTVSTKCTKSNHCIRRFVPNAEGRNSGNADEEIDAETNFSESDKMRSKHFSSTATTVNKEPNKNGTNDGKKSSIPKLPPYDWSSNSFDTSPTCSPLSDSSSPRHRRRQDSKSVPNLPTAERWQNISKRKNAHNAPSRQMRTNSRYQEFYQNDVNGNTEAGVDNQILDNSKSDSTKKNEPSRKESGKFIKVLTLAKTRSQHLFPY